MVVFWVYLNFRHGILIRPIAPCYSKTESHEEQSVQPNEAIDADYRQPD